jgi:uncharacterized membrane protein
MKHADIIKLRELGLITEEQQQKIVSTFNLKEESGKLLLVLSTIGAVLIVAGILLLISANWEAIPRAVKIVVGALLMLSAWGGGWYLREIRGDYRKAGEALYLVGAGLWLANIALIGQIYHLSSRPPNAFLLWFAGIAATPWILRSKALFVLSLLAFGIWIGAEANCAAGLLGGEWEQAQLVLYSLVGLLVLAWGYVLRRGRWSEFAATAEKTGLLAFFLAAYPLCWKYLGWYHSPWNATVIAVLATLGVSSLALLVFGLWNPQLELTRQWRWTWGATLAGLAALVCLALATGTHDPRGIYRTYDNEFGMYWLVSLGLFVACLLLVQVGISLRSKFMVNLAVTMTALILLAAYVDLFGSMATTGWMFLISGVFLLAFGVYLERKRRKFIARIRAGAIPAPQTANSVTP